MPPKNGRKRAAPPLPSRTRTEHRPASFGHLIGIIRSSAMAARPHTTVCSACYSFVIGNPQLGRPAWFSPTCRRGDLVSQRGAERKNYSRSSFERNEGENSR